MQVIWLAILIGVVEGVTEFLPISSTGHMLLVEQALRMDLEKDPFWKLFTIVIQLGAILSIVVHYWPRLRELMVDFFSPRPLGVEEPKAESRVPRWRHPLVLLLMAVFPAGLVGVALEKQIDFLMEHALPLGIALIVWGI